MIDALPQLRPEGPMELINDDLHQMALALSRNLPLAWSEQRHHLGMRRV
ncbi:MAG: hypothetical protein Q8M31_01630 [Beijerinckiaceae bacterium]|nr:hypothetical protein [Beijerinckiaceae bacterium]